jgi:hypothetical protein
VRSPITRRPTASWWWNLPLTSMMKVDKATLRAMLETDGQ